VGVARSRDVDRPGRVIAAERSDQMSAGGAVGAWIEAACRSARLKSPGNVRPRLAARRRMPAQAFALKKYRCGSLPRSKMSDNEDATASLGHSEELSVQNSVSEPIPEFRQRPENGSKRPSSVNRQDTGHVFPDDPARPKAVSKPAKFDGQVATRITQSASSAGDGKGLARGSSNKKVNWPCVVSDLSEVSIIFDLGVPVAK
jgi:hypothetical protein